MEKVTNLDNKIKKYLDNYGLSIGRPLNIPSYIKLEELMKDSSVLHDNNKKRKYVEYYLQEVDGFRVKNLPKLLKLENVTIEKEEKMIKATKTFGIYIEFPKLNVVAALKNPSSWSNLNIEEWKELMGFLSESLYLKYNFSNPDINEVLFDLIEIVQSTINGNGSKERIEKEIIDIVFKAFWEN